MHDTLSVPENILSLLDQRKAGHTLPAPLYTSHDAYEADCAAIFARHWIAVGVTCDVEEEGR